MRVRPRWGALLGAVLVAGPACVGRRADLAPDGGTDAAAADSALAGDAQGAPERAPGEDAGDAAAFGWAVAAGGAAATLEVARVALDRAGNTYVAGMLTGEARFGGQTVGAADQRAGFLTKLDPDGRFLWTALAREATSVTGLAVDPAGNSHLVGSFTEGVSFGADGPALAAPWQAIFAARVAAQGEVDWATAAVSDGSPPAPGSCGFYGPCGDSLAAGRAAVDAAGNLYLAASVRGPATFGTAQVAAPDGALVVAKLDPSGAFRWAQALPAGLSSGGQPPPSVAVADLGRDPAVYVAATVGTGWATAMACPKGACPSSTTDLLLVGRVDAGDGHTLWQANGCLTCGYPALDDLAADGAGGAVLAARLSVPTDYGTQRFVLGARDFGPVDSAALVARCDAAGVFSEVARLAWMAEAVPWPRTPETHALAVDGQSQLYLAGTYYAASSLGTTTLPPPNDRAAFVLRLGGDGRVAAATVSSSSAAAFGLATGGQGELRVAGVFSWPTLFGDTALTPDGPLDDADHDLFVWKLRLP